MALKNLMDVLGDGHHLTIGEHTYTVPHLSAKVGNEFQIMLTVAAKAQAAEQDGKKYTPTERDKELLNDDEERDLYRDALTSDVYQQMQDDGVPFSAIKLAAMYVILYAVKTPEDAEAFWNSGGKAPAPNRAARRTATRTRTGGASTTRKRG